MGWLHNLRKHTTDLDPEPTSLPGAGSAGVSGGAYTVAGSSYGVVPAGGGARTGGVTPANLIIDGKKPGLIHNNWILSGCGHNEYAVIITAGCFENHAMSWVSCERCHMNAIHGKRETTVFLSCLDPCEDLIYTYLPDHPNYVELQGHVFDWKGGIVRMGVS